MSAEEIRTFRNLATKLVKCEERGKLLGNLMSAGIGLRDVEEFVNLEETKTRETNNSKNSKNYKQRREIVSKAMEIKLRDNQKLGVGLRKAKHKLKGKIEEKLKPRSRKCRWIMKTVKEYGTTLREKLKKKNMKKYTFLKGKYSRIENPLDELSNKDVKKYGVARIFSEDNGMKSEETQEPVVVCREGEEIALSSEERDLLALGPKYCIMNNLNEETFEREVEECIVKYRWQLKKEENEEKELKKFGEDAMSAINSLFTEEELGEHIEDEEMKEARSRAIHDYEENSLDFSKKRVTDVKGNSRVILPKYMKNFDLEARLEVFRVECRGVFKKYMTDNCGKYGQQKSNLSKAQLKGLKSLKQRIKDG